MNKYKIAVIGVGRMGKYHVRILSRLKVLSAIVDVDENAGKQISLEYNDTPYYSNYRTMMKEIRPDGVILSTPTSFHFSIAKELLSSYNLKALLIEKPLASTIKEGELLQEIASKSSTLVSVGHIEVYNPIITKILELHKQGILGKIRSMLIQRRGAVSDGRLESIGDVYQDIGIHDFDIATRFLSGSYKLSAFPIEHNGLINASTVILHNKASNIMCTFLLSREFAGKIRRIEIEGTKATLICDLLNQTVVIRQLGIAKGDTNSISIPFGSGEMIKVYGEPLLEEILSFLDTIDGANPLVSIKDGIKGLIIVESARKSGSNGTQEMIQI